MAKRWLGWWTGGLATIWVMVQVVGHLEQRSAPLLLVSLAAFWTARILGAVLEKVCFPRISLLFYEEVARDLAVYSMLAVVSTGAILANRHWVGTDVSPAGPAIVIHILSLLFRRR